MPARRTFGKRQRDGHDIFASLLHSSPDVKSIRDGEELYKDLECIKNIGKRSSQEDKQSILQPISGNSGRKNRGQKVSNEPPSMLNNKSTEEQLATQYHESRTANPSTTLSKRPKDAAVMDTATTASMCADNVELDLCPYEDHCRTLLEHCQQGIESFSDWTSQLSEHLTVSKIAEASFGEVYRLSIDKNNIRHDLSIAHHEESVLKIIALTPPESMIPKASRERKRVLKKTAMMSKPGDVASEVKLLQRMSDIPGFTDFREFRILRGRPSGALNKAYKSYNATQLTNGKDISIFPDPSKRYSYAPDQLWAVIEMRDAGTDLERLLEQGQCNDIWSVWDIFWQVTLALAKGEEGAEFEHRDLHLGNICVRTRSGDLIDATRKLGFTRLEAVLIDYTISRATMSALEDVAYFDLSQDQHIFTGDSAHEYQYDIYRYMRSALHFDDALKDFNTSKQLRSWKDFHPQTNIVWLHFVLHTLLQHISYPSEQKPPPRKARKQYSSWKLANKMESYLLHAQDLLNPEVMIKNGLTSAGMLIVTALQHGWLDEEDVVGGADTTIFQDLTEQLEELRVHDLNTVCV